ncbi:MAG TPA: hypothetical protein VFV89_21840 [Nocardioides sp.]|uniref:hypothetical protein n=1 Tax=Nocardioides sp. TaxID=35761 RepID=UPI002E2F13B6|nr:hypothetical protein [Nocardioides sp.]HEX5090467.1 hypothetical protein [Nocardioides sp.]
MPDKAIEKNKNTKRGLKVAALAGGLVLVGGVAFAYWTQGGTGTGSATTGGTSAITVNQTSTIAGLAPGVGAQTLSGDFDNPNGGPVYVTSVTASISSVVKAAGAPAGTCDASDYTLSGAVMAVGTEVPAGTAQGSWGGATLAFNNKAGTNQDACKGATVNLAYSAS